MTQKEMDMGLLAASARGDIETVRTLLSAGADINTSNKIGCTALIWACVYRHTNTARLLIYRGADIDAADEDGNTALMHAAINGNIKSIKMFIKAGADPSITNKGGLTAFDMLRICHPEKYSEWMVKIKREKLRREDNPDIAGQYVDWDI